MSLPQLGDVTTSPTFSMTFLCPQIEASDLTDSVHQVDIDSLSLEAGSVSLYTHTVVIDNPFSYNSVNPLLEEQSHMDLLQLTYLIISDEVLLQLESFSFDEQEITMQFVTVCADSDCSALSGGAFRMEIAPFNTLDSTSNCAISHDQAFNSGLVKQVSIELEC